MARPPDADTVGRIRPILVTPDPRLRMPAGRIGGSGGRVRELADDLVATMRSASGLGLAAPQIGEPVRLAVVEADGRLLVLVDPRIDRQGPAVTEWEGCLSVPERVARVARPAWVEVRWADVLGASHRLRADGLLARAIAHEVDHLRGVLYVDLVAPEALVDTREHPSPPAG